MTQVTKDEELLEENIFWERLANMPWVEAKEECELRKERLILRISSLSIKLKVTPDKEQRHLIGLEIEATSKLSGVLTRRINDYRSKLDSVSWKNAVKTIFGEEGYALCREWMVAMETSYKDK